LVAPSDTGATADWTETTGHAARIGRYEPPEVLIFAEVLPLALDAHEVRIRTLAAALNHTDLEIRAGNWPVRKPEPFPLTRRQGGWRDRGVGSATAIARGRGVLGRGRSDIPTDQAAGRCAIGSSRTIEDSL
jgi:hypothetical protein